MLRVSDPRTKLSAVEKLIQKQKAKAHRTIKDLVSVDNFDIKTIKEVLQQQIKERDTEKVRYHITGLMRQFTDEEIFNLINEVDEELKLKETKEETKDKTKKKKS